MTSQYLLTKILRRNLKLELDRPPIVHIEDLGLVGSVMIAVGFPTGEPHNSY